MALSFFSSVTNEVSESNASSKQHRATQLAETVIEFTQAQIREATTVGTTTAWASQPGRISNWNNSGALTKTVRLYSWADGTNSLSVSGSTPPADDIPAAWNNYSNKSPINALWCDLNAPVLNSAGEPVFPIADPAAIGVVEGFAVNAAPGAATSGASAPNNNPIPMPVNWLYLLEDGTIVPPSGTPAQVTVSGVTPQNPIVGRIAFWTDDETCKVNINTASEGVFWGVPQAPNPEEFWNGSSWSAPASPVGFAYSVPVSNEYQRTPGHPATTSLSPVLKSLFPVPSMFNTPAAAAQLDPYYMIAPRIGIGGTLAGTRQVTTVAAANMAIDQDRLYANTDELYLGVDRSQAQSALTTSELKRRAFFLTASSRAPETTLFNQPRISLWPIQQETTKRNGTDQTIRFCSEFGKDSSSNPRPYYFQRATTFLSNASPGSSQSSSADAAIARNNDLIRWVWDRMQQPVPGFGASWQAKYPNDYKHHVVQVFDFVRSYVNPMSDGGTPQYSYTPRFAAGNLYHQTEAVAQVVPTLFEESASVVHKGLGRFPTLKELGIIFIATRFKDDTTLGTASPFTPSPGADQLPDDELASAGAESGNYDGIGDPRTSEIRAMLLVQFAMPDGGAVPWTLPAFRVQIEGLNGLSVSSADCGLGLTSLGMPGAANSILLVKNASSVSASNVLSPVSSFTKSDGNPRTLGNSTGSSEDNYPWVGSPISLPTPANPLNWKPAEDNPTTANRLRASAYSKFSFAGGPVTLRFYPANGPMNSSTLVQEISVSLDPFTAPVPMILRARASQYNAVEGAAYTSVSTTPNQLSYYFGSPYTKTYGSAGDPGYGATLDPRDFANRLAKENIKWQGMRSKLGYFPIGFARIGDVIRSVACGASSTVKGDYRIVAARKTILAGDGYFQPSAGYSDSTKFLSHSFESAPGGALSFRMGPVEATSADGGNPRENAMQREPDINATTPASGYRGASLAGVTMPQFCRPVVPSDVGSLQMNGPLAGDFESGLGNSPPGGYIVGSDQGFSYTTSDSFNVYFPANVGFENSLTAGTASSVQFSPTRQVASAVVLGSLPSLTSGASPSPWRTFLFCANPSAKASHPGFGAGTGGTGPAARPPYTTVPDHLLLDYFWMPVVEPYAISEPSSTAGKINLNWRMEPFGSYLERSTGLHAVFAGVRLGALPPNFTGPQAIRTSVLQARNGNMPSVRWEIDAEKTMVGFRNRFSAGQPFRSASEICNIFLVPKKPATAPGGVPPGSAPADYASTPAWWDDYSATGDSLRESPYNALYPRVTTKSNTYTVHYRVQALKELRGSSANPVGVWVEGQDKVESELRGSATIERFIDPNQPGIPDFATAPNESLDRFYRLRVLDRRQFAP